MFNVTADVPLSPAASPARSQASRGAYRWLARRYRTRRPVGRELAVRAGCPGADSATVAPLTAAFC